MISKMTVSVSAVGKADPTLELRAIRMAVASALRNTGVVVNTDDVKIEGKLG